MIHCFIAHLFSCLPSPLLPDTDTGVLLCLVAGAEEEAGASAAAEGGAPERQSSRPPLLRVTSVTDHPEVFDEIGEMEKEFCFSMFDRLMGLLALMLPKEQEVSHE